jgi:hypothetical protein
MLVALPPGRAMLTTRLSSGSQANTMMGIVAVRFGRFGFGLYGYAGGFHSDYGYGACLVPPPNGYAWACY